jgi:hypothetical protein
LDFKWTYAAICSADVRGGTTGCTLLFEYLLVNTQTYEAAMELLDMNDRKYAPWQNTAAFLGL